MPLMRSCWLFATRESRPSFSAVGRRPSMASRSRPFFSSLERMPYLAVRPMMSSSRTRRMTLYWC